MMPTVILPRVNARALVVAALLLAVTATPVRAEPKGSALPGLGPYDELMEGLIRKWDVAGASLSVARGDKLLLARGYGFANREKSIPVQPTSLFRLASLSKTITAVAVLRLVQDKRLGLDDKVVSMLGDMGPRAGR